MKAKLIRAFTFGIVICLSGCSGAYVARWNEKEVTACCPTGKDALFCTQNKLAELATAQCGKPAHAVRGGVVNSGLDIQASETKGQIRSSRDTCTVFECAQ